MKKELEAFRDRLINQAICDEDGENVQEFLDVLDWDGEGIGDDIIDKAYSILDDLDSRMKVSMEEAFNEWAEVNKIEEGLECITKK